MLYIAAVAVIFFSSCYRMRRALPGQKRHLVTHLLAFLAVFLTLSMVRFPKEAFEASVAGLEVWWHIVFPALLPFFVFAQILIGLGVVDAMGVFLQPVMRPVFIIPGTGSFVMAMGLASGFPIVFYAGLRRCWQVNFKNTVLRLLERTKNPETSKLSGFTLFSLTWNYIKCYSDYSNGFQRRRP